MKKLIKFNYYVAILLFVSGISYYIFDRLYMESDYDSVLETTSAVFGDIAAFLTFIFAVALAVLGIVLYHTTHRKDNKDE